MASQPYLAARPRQGSLCLLCNETITANEKKQTIGTSGLHTVEEKAAVWATIKAPEDDKPYHEFTFVSERLQTKSAESHEAHPTCRLKFRTHAERKLKEYGQREDAGAAAEEEYMMPSAEVETEEEKEGRRSSTRNVQQNFLCFICNSRTPKDSNPYSNGGLGRCSEDRAFGKLSDKVKSTDPGDRYEEAAKRLNLLLSGQAFDVFAVDVYYHRKCYVDFTRPVKTGTKDHLDKDEIARMDIMRKKVKNEFLALIERKVIKDKEAYLATDLLEEFGSLSEENGINLEQSSIKYTYELRMELEERFGDTISFFKSGRNLIVHPTSVNPCFYATATLKGAGLRDDDLTRAFASMLRRKLTRESAQEWPISAEDLIARLDNSGPIDAIYNAIAWSINPNAPKNERGYVLTSSKSLARKVWSVSSDWETLLTHERSIKSTALSLTIHRLTGSKEVTTMLNKCGHGVSYSDVRLLNNTWAHQVTQQTNRKIPAGFVKGKPVHVTLDNSDGRQQTITGAHTTHYTNGTVFQNHKAVDSGPIPEAQEEDPVLSLRDCDLSERNYGTYKIQGKKEPPTVPDYEDCKDRDLLDWCLKRDLAWVVVSALGDQVLGQDTDSNLPPVGSWTTFMKAVTTSLTQKSLLNYMEVIPLPPTDNVCKWYMDLLIDMADDFGIQCIFAHSDEAVYCKMVLIQWINEGKYDKIVNLLGGFHTIMVKLRILYKKYGTLGFRDWWVDAGAIAEGSSVQAVEGRHYFRAIRLHKQSFEALLRLRIKKTGDVSLFGEEFRRSLEKLRCNPSASHLENFMSNPEFQKLSSDLMSSSGGTQSDMIIGYLKDVSEMLALISAVREKSIERHMQAERALLPQLFAFGHMNYARYLTFQHVTITNLHQTNPDAWAELRENGFGGSLSGGLFSSVHGDYVTEVTINREVKVRGGPLQGGYSTSLKAEDDFIKTSHLMARVRAALKEKLSIVTASVHKETTQGARNQHEKTVQSMIDQMGKYMDPFARGVARHFKTGEGIPEDVVRGLVQSTQIGESLLMEFIEERLKREGHSRVSFFKAIPNPKIKTGLEKPKKTPKVVNILKEEKQAFGALVGKATTAKEAHSYPLTSVPLALSTEESGLRQGAKSSLRNHIIEEAKAEEDKPPARAEWLVDGMAAVQAVPPRKTWKEYAESLLNFCMPPATHNPVSVAIIMDTYGERRTKNQTRRKGQSGLQGRRIFITEPGQSMPQGKDWSAFLSSGENKSELIRFLVEYYKSQAVRSALRIPLLITETCNTWRVSPEEVTLLETCNHQEADTRLVRHASLSDKPVVVVAADTDVFILMMYAFYKSNPCEKWFMKIERNRYLDIGDICKAYGEEICDVLPGYHSLTGCDTTSYPYKVGKVKPLKKMITQSKANLLSPLGQRRLSKQDAEEILSFMQTIMYPGKPDEEFVDTRMRMYEQMKTKSSLTLLPDRYSAEEHVKRANLQTYIWKQCLHKDIDYPNPEEGGWQVQDDSLVPVWFHCSQFPPSISRRKPRRQKHRDETDWADDESEEPPPVEPPKKKQRQHTSRSSKQHHPGVETCVGERSTTSESSSSSEIVLSDSETETYDYFSDESE